MSISKFVLKKKILKDLPETPGVYFFWKGKTPIYIGKAINLKNRLSTYLTQNLLAKTKAMVTTSDNCSFIKVDSELEALLLEASLISKHQPKFNIELKDDKHPLYIQITKEEFPRVLTARKIKKEKKNIAFFGPFPSSQNVKKVLRIIRRVFPYSDHRVGKRGCLYSQIGLCNPCPSEVARIEIEIERKREKKRYLANIRYIKNTLSGKIDRVKKELRESMLAYAKKQEYEKAELIKNKLSALDYITQPVRHPEDFIKNPNLIEDLRNEELLDLKKILTANLLSLSSLRRIECFDVAHLGGTYPTASMVTFINGHEEKGLYRHFRIRQSKGSDDLSSMSEVIKRRKNHMEGWGRPDLIIVDGGKTQVAVFLDVLEGFKIPVVGIAKTEEKLFIPTKEDNREVFREVKLFPGPAKNLIQRLRNEAHRFARVYHHKLLRKSLVG